MKRYILLLCFYLNIFVLYAQFVDMGFASKYIDSVAHSKTRYTSLEEALKKPEKVEILILKNKGFKTFPTEIFKFKNLQILNLDENQISEIPPQINQLKKLVGLSIQMNQLRTLPKEFGELNMIELNLSVNFLTELSESITNQKSLKLLLIISNDINSLPQHIVNLTSLEALVIVNNKGKQRMNIDILKQLEKLKHLIICSSGEDVAKVRRHLKGEPKNFMATCEY